MIASLSVSESSLRNLSQNLSISKVREPHEVSSEKALSSASWFISSYWWESRDSEWLSVSHLRCFLQWAWRFEPDPGPSSF